MPHPTRPPTLTAWRQWATLERTGQPGPGSCGGAGLSGAFSRIASAATHGKVLALGRAYVELAWAGDLELGVLDHLVPLGDPARQPPEGEHNREHLGGEAQRPVDQPGVEIHVRVQLALDEVLIRERHLLELERDVEQLVALAKALQELVGGLLDDGRARVPVLVDPVPEAHELGAALFVLDLADELVDVATISLDLLEHVEHSLVGATVQGPEQGVDPGRDRGEQVRVARPD